MVSLKDIAKACGVSTATVSKALNGQNDIGEATKQRIKEKAKEMGYLPNAAARMLKTNHSKNIGVLYADEAGSGLTHEYFSGVLNGIRLQAEKQGYDITFINTNHEGRSHLEHVRYRNFDGVIIVCANFAEAQVVELMNSDVPVVTIDYVYHNCSAVSSNNVKGIEDLMNYVLSKGHKRIAYVHGQSYSYVTKERLAAYYRSLESHGIEAREAYVREALYLETEEAAKQTKALLDLKEAPTCILYPDDTAAIGGINAIRERGLRIPEDISIAGYDGSKISKLMKPTFTTIDQDTNQIGVSAASQLIQMIENPKTSLMERIVVDGRLVEGESVGTA